MSNLDNPHDRGTPDNVPDHAVSARAIAHRQGLCAVDGTHEKAPARTVLEQLLAGSAETSLVEAIVAAHAATHARSSYAWSQVLGRLVVDAAEPHLPEVRIEAVDGEVLVINPRTGQPDRLVVVNSSIRHTMAEAIDPDDLTHQQVQFNCDGSGEFESLLHVTASDHLPVRLPAGWTEAGL